MSAPRDIPQIVDEAVHTAAHRRERPEWMQLETIDPCPLSAWLWTIAAAVGIALLVTTIAMVLL